MFKKLEQTIKFVNASIRLCFIPFLLQGSLAAAGTDGIVHLSAPDFVERGEIWLIESWKYHSGDNDNWALPEFDDTPWLVANTRLRPDSDITNNWSGVGWFRLDVTVDSALVNKPMAVNIRLSGSAEVYLNGVLVHTFNDVAVTGSQPNGVPGVFTFDNRRVHLLAVRYSNEKVDQFQSASFDSGFFLRLGNLDHVIRNRTDEAQTLTAYQMFFTSLALAVGFLHLLLFIFSPITKQNLYFALFLFSYAAAIFLDYQSSTPESISQQLYYLRLHRAVMVPFLLFGLRFAYSLFYRSLPKQFWIFFLITCGLGALAVYQPGKMFFVFGSFMFVVFIEIGRATVSAFFKKQQDILLVGFAFFMFFTFITFDALMDFGLPVPFREMQNPYAFGTVGFFIAMSVYLSRNFARTQRLEAEHARKTRELEEARDLQLSMLPQNIKEIQGLDICFHMQTATEVGGDYYDYNLTDDGFLTIAVGDATGHGMKAGTMVSVMKSLFVATGSDMEIVPFFDKCSQTIRAMRLGNLYMALMMLKIKDSQLTVSSAGMPPILIYREKTGDIEELLIKGMPLGGSKSFPYQQRETSLAPGDTVLLMSDGLPELFNDKNEMLEYSRIKEIFKQKATASASEIVEHLGQISQQWMNGRDQEDDITLVVFKVLPENMGNT